MANHDHFRLPVISRRSMLQACAAGAAAIGVSGKPLLGDTPMRTAVDFEVPPGASDCHVHIFNPAKFPFSERRVYTPPPASVEDLLQLQHDLHLSRVVVVQPSIYGVDNSCTLDALRQLGARARGIAVIDQSTRRESLAEMKEAGICGVRLNLEVTAEAIEPDAAKKLIAAVTEKITGLGWHLQILTRPAIIAALNDRVQ